MEYLPIEAHGALHQVSKPRAVSLLHGLTQGGGLQKQDGIPDSLTLRTDSPAERLTRFAVLTLRSSG